LKCNGDAIANGSGTTQGVTANFAALYALVGSQLPDLRGEFIRGWDDGRGIDSGRGFRTNQSDEFKTHQHLFGGDDQIEQQGSYTGVSDMAYDASSQTSGDGHNYRTKNDNSNYGGTETRPRNMALLACIKY
jgi:phage-related tail fiber protein